MTLKTIVLGAGYFAAFHHEAWRRLPWVTLRGIADLDLDKAQAAAGEDARAFGSLQDALETEVPDILDVAVPPPAHAEAIRMGLAAGVRAIICQKPFGTSLKEAEDLTNEAEAAGIPLIIHENFRWQPWYRIMREVIEDGRLGPVQNLTFRLRTGDGQGPEAYLDRQPYFQTMPRLLVHETAVHWLDTFRYLMGEEPTHIYADLRRLNPVILGEDAGHILLDFASGARAMFDGNRHLDHAADNPRTTLGEALIEGPRGNLTLDGWGRVLFRTFGRSGVAELLPKMAWDGFAGDCVFHLQAHVVTGLRDGTAFENTARDYLAVRRMEEAAYRSAEDGRKVALL